MPNSNLTVVPPENGLEERRPDPASQAGPPKSRSKRKLSRDDLVEASLDDWEKQSPEVREGYYKQTEADFFAIVDSYRKDQNSATERSLKASRSSRWWQIGLTIATGLMTIINGFIALNGDSNWAWVPAALATAMPAVAVLYAGCLTIAQNVERSLKKADEASTWRDQGELLLNQYREYSSKWVNYVEAFGETPTAYRNAGRLYKELVDSDQVLRQQLRQLKSPVKGNPQLTGQLRQTSSDRAEGSNGECNGQIFG
jgi:hypothetical protein